MKPIRKSPAWMQGKRQERIFWKKILVRIRKSTDGFSVRGVHNDAY
ncbi:MAG: hypothetical protein IJ530_05915 [Treponema sp.]|nr:hypothetical protein [Treponema sp.]MBQ8679281.1 hypothetical protein [Treponema sp.]